MRRYHLKLIQKTVFASTFSRSIWKIYFKKKYRNAEEVIIQIILHMSAKIILWKLIQFVFIINNEHPEIMYFIIYKKLLNKIRKYVLIDCLQKTN